MLVAMFVIATTLPVDRDRFYRQMLVYSGVVVGVGPGLAWLFLVVRGW